MKKLPLFVVIFSFTCTLLSAQVVHNYVSSDWCLIDEDSVFFAPAHIVKNKIRKVTEYITDEEYSFRDELNRVLHFDSLGRVIEYNCYGDHIICSNIQLIIDSAGQTFEWYHIAEDGTKKISCATIYKDMRLIKQVSYNVMYYVYSEEYIYDMNGMVIQQNHLQNDVVMEQNNFFYDTPNRMIASTHDGSYHDSNVTYQYDSLGRKTLILKEYKFYNHKEIDQGVDSLKFDYSKSTARDEVRIEYRNDIYLGEFTTKTNSFSDVTAEIEDRRKCYKNNSHFPKELLVDFDFGEPYLKRVYSYDAKRRLKSLKIYHTPFFPKYKTKYTYDLKGNIIKITQFEGRKLKKEYRYTYEY
jgi:hypothetical protein